MLQAISESSSGLGLAVMIGTFDPLLPEHHQALRELCVYAQGTKLCPAIVILDPSPARYISFVNRPTTYHCLQTRAELIKEIGINDIFKFQFEESYIDEDAFFFLNSICSKLPIKELWLGKTQTLGSGPRGSLPAIEHFCQTAKIGLQILEDSDSVKQRKGLIKNSLSKGQIQIVRDYVGKMPEFHRCCEDVVETNWLQGKYRAIAWTFGEPEICTIEMVEIDSYGATGFYWHDKFDIIQIQERIS